MERVGKVAEYDDTRSWRGRMVGSRMAKRVARGKKHRLDTT